MVRRHTVWRRRIADGPTLAATKRTLLPMTITTAPRLRPVRYEPACTEPDAPRPTAAPGSIGGRHPRRRRAEVPAPVPADGRHQPPRFAGVPAPAPADVHHPARAAVRGGRSPRVAPCPHPRSQHDDELRRRVAGVLRLLLEVLDGRRAAVQLAPHLAPQPLRYVRAAGRRPRKPSRLTSLHVCRLSAAAAEIAAVYRVGSRARALAARFEQEGATWRCTAVRLA